MAERIAAVMDAGGVLICEAGTGTGKTFAYLVPALLSGRKVIDLHRHAQSPGSALPSRSAADPRGARRCRSPPPCSRDAPIICAAIGSSWSWRICTHLDPELRAHLKQVQDWSKATRRGDIAELPIPEDAPVWPAVTSTTDNCLGQDCPDWQDCHLVAARREAQAADLVVVNHHLFCADLALKDEGFGEILPGADCFVLDEAHQLPETASSFFGIRVSSRQLLDLARDTELEARREAGDVPELPERADAAETRDPGSASGPGRAGPSRTLARTGRGRGGSAGAGDRASGVCQSLADGLKADRRARQGAGCLSGARQGSAGAAAHA